MRIWPTGLAGRFALLLIGALLVANLVAVVLLAAQRQGFDARAATDRQVARLVGIVPLLEETPRSDWNRVLRRGAGRRLDVSIDPRPLADPAGQDAISRGVAARLTDLLDGRAVLVAQHPMPARRGRVLLISVALQGPHEGLWLNGAAERPAGESEPTPGVGLVLILGSSFVAVLSVGLWFLRGLTRPLQALANAAEAAGAGDRTARVPVAGAREVQAAAVAFNTMQDRIAAFDAERLRMVAAVGHDLRTPITSLRIRAEMLDDEVQREAMVATLDEMAVMAEGLVSFARSGVEAEAAVLVNLRPLLARIASERGANLVEGPDTTLQGRPVALGRALANLVDNAMRYGGGGEVAMAIADSWVTVTIADRGPGLPEDKLEAMFDPFVRGEDSRNRHTGGTGLGLASTRQIVQAHGGTVRLQNREGGGLVAEVRLPRAGH